MKRSFKRKKYLRHRKPKSKVKKSKRKVNKTRRMKRKKTKRKLMIGGWGAGGGVDEFKNNNYKYIKIGGGWSYKLQ